MTDVQTIAKFLTSPDWPESVKHVIKWQYRLNGDFETALWGAIVRADEDNLARLERGFPEQVLGYRAWAHGDLGTRLRAAGLDI
jgi:hypothetical protein